MFVTVVFPNFSIFYLNLTADLGVDVVASERELEDCSAIVKLYKMK